MEALRNYFKKLDLILNGEPYIRFKDNAFFKLCLQYWDTDNDGGITRSEGNNTVTFYSSPFKENSDIVNATEFKYLSWTYLDNRIIDLFRGCVNLQSVSLKDNTPLTGNMFLDCISLKNVELPAIVQYPDSGQGSVFMNCTSLKTVDLPQNKQVYGDSYFRNSGIEILVFPDATTTIGNYICFYNTALHEVYMGENITAIGNQSFNSCKNIIRFSIAATIPPILANKNSFDNTTFSIYVPIGCGEAYKTATNWSALASRIQEYNFNNE